MVEHIENNNSLKGFLSEQEKAQLGLDIPSFARRMKARLSKVRGENNETQDSFLIRHHYYKSSNALA